MTEAEWVECSDPKPMFESLLGMASDRKMGLFACGCCRRIWHHLVDERSRKAIEKAEQFIEGEIDREILATAVTAANAACLEVTSASGIQPEYEAAVAAAKASICARVTADEFNRDAWIYAAEDTSWHVRYALDTEAGEQAALLRDLFGNSFHSVTLNPAWQTTTVVHLAHAAYEERHLPSGMLAAVRLAILADALEEAGCTASDVLSHLRSPGPHVRGCWVVDLILGKQ